MSHSRFSQGRGIILVDKATGEWYGALAEVSVDSDNFELWISARVRTAEIANKIAANPTAYHVQLLDVKLPVSHGYLMPGDTRLLVLRTPCNMGALEWIDSGEG